LSVHLCSSFLLFGSPLKVQTFDVKVVQDKNTNTDEI
jgi:hypothetical protein